LTNNQNENRPEERDLLDSAMELPLVGAGVSRLRRVLGPSCLASLVIFLLFMVLFRRWVRLPPIGMLILLFIIWWLVLSLSVRFRNSNPDGDETSDEVIERK
jgi:hypothetical protein